MSVWSSAEAKEASWWNFTAKAKSTRRAIFRLGCEKQVFFLLQSSRFSASCQCIKCWRALYPPSKAFHVGIKTPVKEHGKMHQRFKSKYWSPPKEQLRQQVKTYQWHAARLQATWSASSLPHFLVIAMGMMVLTSELLKGLKWAVTGKISSKWHS